MCFDLFHHPSKLCRYLLSQGSAFNFQKLPLVFGCQRSEPNQSNAFYQLKSISQKDFAGGFTLFATFVETSYFRTDTRKFESTQREESSVHYPDSSKSYNKRRVSNIHPL